MKGTTEDRMGEALVAIARFFNAGAELLQEGLKLLKEEAARKRRAN